jgi:hypothetical protein
MKLFQDAMYVVLYGRDFDAQVPRDLFVRETTLYELNDLMLASGEVRIAGSTQHLRRERGDLF